LNHPRFRAAYDLFLLRAECGLADRELAKFWTDVQLVDHDQRIEMALALGTTPHLQGAEQSAESAGAGDDADGEAGDEPGPDGTPVKRRRRRRTRRPRGAGGGPADG